MQYVFFIALSICILIFSENTSYAAQGTPTTPTSIMLFSNQAVVTTVEENILPQNLPDVGEAFVLLLPASAQPSSLHVTVDGMNTTSVIWPEDQDLSFSGKSYELLFPENIAVAGWPLNFSGEQSSTKRNLPHASNNQNSKNNWVIPQTLLPQEEKDPNRKQLLEIYAALEKEASIIQGRINAAKTTIGLWEKAFASGVPASTDSISKIESIINNRIPAITVSLNSDLEEHLDTQRKLKKALQDIAIYDKTHRVRKAYVVVEKKTPSSAASLRYTYTMEASNTPSYRVNAMPSSNTITIDQLANIDLQVPSTWKNVDLSLVFSALNSSPSLELPIPWELAYQESETYYTSRQSIHRSAPKLMAAIAAAESSVIDSAKDSPSQQEMSTFRLWNLGKQTFMPNEQRQIILSSATYKAEYYYTIRPSIRNEAYLFANIQFPTPIEMPYGKATYSIDGIYAGEQDMALSGKKGVFQLGYDPQIKVQVKDLEKTRGSQGIINKEQTGTWNWEITVTNFRNRTIIARVEEPAPTSLDQTIKITTASTPDPELVIPDEPNADSSLKLLVWKKELKPQESFIIKHKVQATFVKDKNLLSNR